MIDWVTQQSAGLSAETRCRLLQQATKRFPQRTESWYLLGAALLDNYQNTAAEQAFQRAIDLEPDHFNALCGLGLAYQRQRHIDQAIETYRLCLHYYPDAVSIYESLASAYLSSGRIDLAITTCERWLLLKPGCETALTLLADMHIRQGKLQQALDYLAPLIRSQSTDTHSLALRVLIHGLQQEWPDARALLAKDRFFTCIDSNPPDPDQHKRICAALKTTPRFWEPPGYTLRKGASVSQLTQFPDPDIRALLTRIRQQVDEYITHLKRLPNIQRHPFLRAIPSRIRLDAWAGIQEKGGHELPHIHRRAWLSGVYYLQVPKQQPTPLEMGQPGSIEFCGCPYDKDSGLFDDIRFSIQPQAGQMLLFPSYYYHRTWPQTSNDQRIMVAFDVMAG